MRLRAGGGRCDSFEQSAEVCLALQLQGIRWRALVEKEEDLAAPLRAALKTTAHVSRRGGVMLRVIMPRETAWGEVEEAAVVRDCDRLLAVMRAALAGRTLA